MLFFVAWELFCVISGMSDLVLPRPSEVFVTLYQKFPLLWPHILQTLATTIKMAICYGCSVLAADCHKLHQGTASTSSVSIGCAATLRYLICGRMRREMGT